MNAPLFRIIHKPGLSRGEVSAACRALERFRAYGVTHDAMVICEEAVRDVRMGWHFTEALGLSGPVSIDSSGFLLLMHGMGLDELGRNRVGTIGIGLTDEPLSVSDSIRGDGGQEALGVARYRFGALVSLAAVRDTFGFRKGEYCREPELALRAVELAVLNQAGHVLIESYERRGDSMLEERNCPHRSCLMQDNSGPVDFIERVVRFGLDFCFDCKKRILLELGQLRDF